MEFVLKIVFILLGIISLLVGKYQSLKIIMSKTEKYKMIDEKNYIKYSRLPFYVLGFYYILLGIVLLFINCWPTMIICFGPITLGYTKVTLNATNSGRKLYEKYGFKEVTEEMFYKFI